MYRLMLGGSWIADAENLVFSDGRDWGIEGLRRMKLLYIYRSCEGNVIVVAIVGVV